MEVKYYYRQARACGLTAAAAIAAARRHVATTLADYNARLSVWQAEPDKRRYAPGGVANRPKLPPFPYAPRYGLALREVEKPRWLDHDGYYTDDAYDNTLQPRVWRLSNGSFLAGYYASSWGDTEFDRRSFADDANAWRAADRMADRDAESAREYDEAQRAQQALSDRREALREARSDARELIAVLRDLPQGAASRNTVCALIRACRNRMSGTLRSLADTKAEMEKA